MIMYIEHTPLEHNLQELLRIHRSSNHIGVAAIRAAARSLHEAGSREVHDHTSGALGPLLRDDTCATAQIHQQPAKTPQCTVSQETAATTDTHSPIADSDANEHYELIDVIDTDANGEYQLIDIIDTERAELATSRKPPENTKSERTAEGNCGEIVCEIDDSVFIVQIVENDIKAVQKHTLQSAAAIDDGPLRQRFAGKPPPPPPPPPLLIEDPAPRHRVLNSTLPLSRAYRRLVEDVAEARYEEHDQYTPGSPQLDSILNAFQDLQDTIQRTHQQNTQMGIELFNKLRKFLNLDKAQSNYTPNHEENRKRRSESNPRPEPIKYRRVENSFPKFLSGPLDDDVEIVNPFSAGQENREYQYRYGMQSRDNMNLQSPPKPNDAPVLRKSIFSAPHTTNKLIKNTSYADVDYCDGDDVELINGGAQQPSHSFKLPRHSAQLETSRERAQPNDNGRRLTYSEALRQNMPSLGGYVLGRRFGGSMCSSAASTSGASGRAAAGGLVGSSRLNSFAMHNRSILSQEMESLERRKYQELLEKMVPCLYGPESGPQRTAGIPERLQNSQNSSRRQSNVSGLKHLLSGRKQPAAMNSAYTVNLLDDDDDDVGGGELITRKNTPDWGIRRRPGLSGANPPATSTARNTPLSNSKLYASAAFAKDIIDVDDDKDVTFTGIVRAAKNRPVATIDVDDNDDDVTEVVDLTASERSLVNMCKQMRKESDMYTKDTRSKKTDELPYVEPVNSLKERFNASPHLKENWLEKFRLNWAEKKAKRSREVIETQRIVEQLASERRMAEQDLQRNMQTMSIIDGALIVVDDFPEPAEDDEEGEFKDFTDDQLNRIRSALMGCPDQVLITKFSLNIARRDILTLMNLNWLNDEVINFYMSLLNERSEKNPDLPKVYAMNTFFLPRIHTNGYSGVRRWTRKFDLFAKDIVPVPVHVGGVHWCMAIIHFKERSIKYYDSMGTPNPTVLRVLQQYLQDESMDKRKQPFDFTDYQVESVQNVPRQHNGSDCGVFSCMFAEYITRNKEINFSQENMPYFRQKMILEILDGTLYQ